MATTQILKRLMIGHISPHNTPMNVSLQGAFLFLEACTPKSQNCISNEHETLSPSLPVHRIEHSAVLDLDGILWVIMHHAS